MTSLGVPSLSYAQRLGRAAVRTTELNDTWREELFPLPRKFTDREQKESVNRRRDVRNPFLRNGDLSPDLQGSVDIKLKLGFIEPAVNPRSQNRLKKVMLYDNVCEQRKLELNLVKLSTEEKRCVENIIHRKAEFVEELAKNAAVSSNRSKQRPSSESTYGSGNHLISSRHKGGYIPGLRLEASSKLSTKSRSGHESLARRPLSTLLKFPAISKGSHHHTSENHAVIENFSNSKSYFADVTRKCLADGRFQRLRETLIPPEERKGVDIEDN